jgi:protein-tyrosine kinase
MMAKFRDSVIVDAPSPTTHALEVKPRPPERLIGEILQETVNLTAEQIEGILACMHDRGIRFGEAAVALGFVTSDDVMYALAQQFHYPYAPRERRHQAPELVALNQPFSSQSEAFRAIRSQLMMRVFSDGDRRRALAVISPNAGDGKTFFSANIAVTLAQLGGRTLVVDGDLRKPRLHEVFGIDNAAGLSSILSGRAEAQVVQQVMGVPSLYVLPVGIVPPNPLELIERPAFGILMRELTAKFDYVLVDTPAAVHGTDAQVVAARCGAALLVARKDESRIAALQDLAASVADTASRLAGVIINEF